MTSIDYTVLTLYLAGVFLLGIGLAIKNRSANDMFAAGGQAPAWTSGLSAFMTMFSAGTFVVWGGIAYRHGLVAVTINLCYGVAALLVGFLIAGRWKRLGVRTPAQFIELRFGQSAVQLYTWSMMAFRMVGVGVALYALSVILVALMPLPEGHFLRDAETGNLSLFWAIMIFGGTVIIYTMVGGLWGVLMTDVLQFIVLNIAVLFVIPLILASVGGLSGFVAGAPEGFFSLIQPPRYTWFFMLGWVMIHFFMVGAEWAFAQRFICVPTERDARHSTYLFGVLYLVSPIFWMLPPMVYRLVDPDADPDQAYILACQSVLPVGMMGLMVAAMFSATASMVSSQLNVFAGVLTEEFYQRLINPGASDRRLLAAGRLFTILLGTTLIAVALAVPYMGGAEKVVISITSLMVGPLLAPTVWGLLGKRVSSSAVWITAGTCFLAGVVTKFVMGLSGTTLDVMLGVFLPLALLTVMHALQKKESPGWERVMKLERETQRIGAATKASRAPALIVAGSLFLFAALFFVLIRFNPPVYHRQLSIFGAVLLLIAIAILACVFLTRKRSAPQGH